VNGVLVKQGRYTRIKNMGQDDPQSKWSTDLQAFKASAVKDMMQFRAVVRNMSREAKQMWSDKLKVYDSVHADRLLCCRGEKVVFDCSSYSQAWDHLVGGQPKRRKTDTASTGASTSRPTPEHDHLQGESDVSMDDGDGFDADKLERPRSVARTLGNRRFQRAPGRLSFDESQQLDQGVAADALDNVLGLLQRKTREAYVVPWYKKVKRGWTYLHDGELCELHAVEYAKDKEPRLMVRLLERNTVAPKIIELHEGDVFKLTVFKRPKPTETHATPTWAQYVEATKASDGPGSHCSSCFKPLGREVPCSKYVNVMPVLHLCDECVRREQPWRSTMNMLLGSLGPAIRFDLGADAMADLASVCSESVRSKLDVVVAAPCPRCNHLVWESVGDEKLYKTTPFTFVNISTSGLTMSEQPLVTWRCDCNPEKLVEPRLIDAAIVGLSAVRTFVRPEEDGRSVIDTSARGQVFANAAGMDTLAALRFGAHLSFKHFIECMQETSRSHGMLVTPMSSRLRGELLRAVTLRQRILHVLRRQLTAHLGLAECLVCSTATDSILVDFTHANSQRERKGRKPLAEDAEEAPMNDAATTDDAATSSTVDGAPSASATAPTAAPEPTQGVASASSAAPSASSDGAAPMAPPGATPSSPTSDATTPLSSDASTPASATASTPAAAASSASLAGDPDNATDDLLRHGFSLLQPIEVMEASLKSSKARTAEDATAGADDADDADAKGPPDSDAPFRCPLDARQHHADNPAGDRAGKFSSAKAKVEKRTILGTVVCACLTICTFGLVATSGSEDYDLVHMLVDNVVNQKTFRPMVVDHPQFPDDLRSDSTQQKPFVFGYYDIACRWAVKFKERWRHRHGSGPCVQLRVGGRCFSRSSARCVLLATQRTVPPPGHGQHTRRRLRVAESCNAATSQQSTRPQR